MVNFNGDLLAPDTHFLNHRNRGLRYGDALFEILRFDGSNLLFWEDHYFRLMASMRRLRMEIPMDFTMEHLEAEIRKMLKAGGDAERPARIRFTVYREGGGGYSPEALEVSFIIEYEPLDQEAYVLDTTDYRADLFRDYFLQADELSGLGHNNKILHVLAGIYARENELDTCILLNHKKGVSETIGGNIFLRMGDRIKTPPLSSGCRDGVMRKQLLALNKTDLPFEWIEEDVSPFELQQADELFISNIAEGIRPVTAYRKARYGTAAASQALEKINAQIRVKRRLNTEASGNPLR